MITLEPTISERAGVAAGHVGYELVGAGMLIMAGGGNGKPLDYGELERWTRAGSERGTASQRGER